MEKETDDSHKFKERNFLAHHDSMCSWVQTRVGQSRRGEGFLLLNVERSRCLFQQTTMSAVFPQGAIVDLGEE